TAFSDTTVLPGTAYLYTVDAFDAAGNRSAQSAPASATTPPIADTEPPTVPTNLTAIASQPTRVDLAWTASTDNVGVAGYTIYRGGSLLTTVTGGATTYPDVSVQPNTAYTYTVDAYDAAGNHSAQSPPVSVATQGLLFSDGFESGNLSLWTAKSGMLVQQQEVYAG